MGTRSAERTRLRHGLLAGCVIGLTLNTPLTVNAADASYLNTIGDAELRAVWTDPDFDAGQRAFYYARVLEIPTPTWQAYDSNRFGVTMPETVQMFAQERAYTSPIWYTP